MTKQSSVVSIHLTQLFDVLSAHIYYVPAASSGLHRQLETESAPLRDKLSVSKNHNKMDLNTSTAIKY